MGRQPDKACCQVSESNTHRPQLSLRLCKNPIKPKSLFDNARTYVQRIIINCVLFMEQKVEIDRCRAMSTSGSYPIFSWCMYFDGLIQYMTVLTCFFFFFLLRHDFGIVLWKKVFCSDIVSPWKLCSGRSHPSALHGIIFLSRVISQLLAAIAVK